MSKNVEIINFSVFFCVFLFVCSPSLPVLFIALVFTVANIRIHLGRAYLSNNHKQIRIRIRFDSDSRMSSNYVLYVFHAFAFAYRT